MNRSYLFVPGIKLEFINNIDKYHSDIFVIDLEDSVPLNKKQEAYIKTVEFFKKKNLKNKKIYIRINLDKGLIPNNLKVLVNNKITCFILPKVKKISDIKKFEKILDKIEKQKKIKKKIKLCILVETIDAVLNLRDLVNSSKRINSIIYGEEDFHSEINNINFSHELKNDYAKKFIPLIAKSKNIEAIYTPYLDLTNKNGLKNHILESIKMGYTGLLLIHPSQIEIANTLYQPSETDKKIINAVLKSDKIKKYEGRSVYTINNKVIGPPMIRRSQNILDKFKIKK
jgi:citrate lyase subunit beta/citryl-CoA lyase